MQLKFEPRQEITAWTRVVSLREMNRLKKYLEDKNHLVREMDWKMQEVS